MRRSWVLVIRLHVVSILEHTVWDPVRLGHPQVVTGSRGKMFAASYTVACRRLRGGFPHVTDATVLRTQTRARPDVEENPFFAESEYEAHDTQMTCWR